MGRGVRWLASRKENRHVGHRRTHAERQGIEVVPDVVHQFRNASREDIHFLDASHPRTKGGRIED
jgi:hypothetical protein